uniref:Uncharacterized protein n=1 Tax=Anguilla anguilla TaxID=7936 RepID=A0A0E9SDB5_ANGAN
MLLQLLSVKQVFTV